MIYLAIFIFAFAIIRFLVALTNLIFDPRIKQFTLKEKPFVSILIPARNEENTIGNLLNDLSGQDYSNCEIIVYDDNSSDTTKSIVENIAIQNPKIKLIHAKNLPDGWLGKNFGCYTLAQHATGQYFLFLDADVRVKGKLIESSIAHLQKHSLGMLSIFPKQIMKTQGEKLIVPVMNVILLSLLPLILVRISKKPSLAAANGQFMLFNAEVYQRLRPHELFKNNKVEDISIAGYFKKEAIKIDCLTGDSSISCRMYTNYSDAVLGFTKNMSAFFGNSFLISSFYWLITTFGIFIIAIALPVGYLFSFIIIVALCRIFISVCSEQNIIENLIYMAPQQYSIADINFKTITNNYFKRNTWKGRNID